MALVTIEPGSGGEPPLFCVHAEAGDVSLYHALAGHLASERAVLGLCAPPAGELAEHERLEQMAARHVREIRGAQADGPYVIVGECTGGALAYEIAQQLRAAGQEVALLALIDAWAPGLPRPARWMPKPVYRVVHRVRILAFHVENLVRLGMREKLVYAASKARRAGRALSAKASAVLRGSAAGVSPQLAFRQALAAYDPEPYAGSIVLLRAATMPLASQAPPDLGWGGLVERVEVETIPGYFTTPISEPGARILAEKLARRLLDACGYDVEVWANPRVRRGAASLADLAQTIAGDLEQGQERDALRLLFGFSDDFRGSSRAGRLALLRDEPPPTGDARFDAALAGVAELFALEGALVAPAWVDDPGRFVEPWWFVASRPEFHAYTLAHTPAVLARHGVFMAREVFDRV